MSVVRSREVPQGMRAGIAVCILGVILLTGAFGLEVHAANGDRLLPGEGLEITAPHPYHVVGVMEPGVDAGQPAQCTITSAASIQNVDVRIRQNAFEAIRAGQRVRVSDQPATLTCNQPVTVTSGSLVWAYPMAGNLFLQCGYAGIALFGFTYARRRSRSPTLSDSPVRAGDDGAIADLRRLTTEAVLGTVKVTAGSGAIVLGIAGLFAAADRSVAALAFLASACALGAVALVAARRSP